MTATDEKALTYEEAKRLCRMAFDAGAEYASTSMQYNCNAVAYDWEHWLEENKRLFMPAPTVEDVLFSYGQACIRASNEAETDAAKQTMLAKLREECAAKLRLADDGKEQ